MDNNSPKIIADVFLKRLDLLVSRLSDQAFCILSGKEEGSIKPKTKAMFIWLFGYDMIETIFIATRKHIVYLASQKKLNMMEEIKSKFHHKYELHLIPKTTDLKSNFERIRQIIGDITFLIPQSEKQAGTLALEWNDFAGFPRQLDSELLINELLAQKDDQELGFVDQSAKLTSRLMKKLMGHVVTTIDQGKKVTHAEIAQKVVQQLENAADKQRIIKELNLGEFLFDITAGPIVQSGGKYSLNIKGQSTKDALSPDLIVFILGTEVNEYNTLCARTVFINPKEVQKKLYRSMLEVQSKLHSLLVPGTQLCDVYREAKNLLEGKLKELGINSEVPKSFGHGIGLELIETLLDINEKNTHAVQKGEVYYVQVALEGLQNGQQGIEYTIVIGDMATVTTGQPHILTNEVKKSYQDISYSLQEESADEQDQKNEEMKTGPSGARARGKRNQQIQVQRENEKKRQKHQEELAKLKQQELEERLEKDQFVQNFQEKYQSILDYKAFELDKVQCYKSIDHYPKEAQKGQIHIDNLHNSILVPFQGGHIPFHVSCVKNVSKIDEGRMGSSIRINFFTTETSAGQIQFPVVDGQVIFIKELQYRSKKADRPQNLINQIKQLQKKVKAEQQVEKEKQNVGDHEALILNKQKRLSFKDLKIRPVFGQGKGAGVLEVHQNGFRYYSSSKETLDIPFKNIKHYIYQSPEKEIIAALHFHLHTPIMIGRKKTFDVQCYSELQGGVEHLEGRKKTNRNDDDEVEEEERLRKQRKNMAKEFEAFIKSIEEQSGDYKIVFEKPQRALGFEGNWNRARLFLQPTPNTLMHVIETSPFILTLSEVEICCFERIIPGIKSFDLVFVFKNYDRPVLRIESIDIKDLEEVKNWLDRMNLLYFEVAQNLVWKNVLGQIQKDIHGFVQDGGWTNILAESDDEGENQEDPEAGDSEFSPGGSGDESDDDYEYSEDDDEEGEDDDDDDEDASEDEEDMSDVIDFDNISDQEEEDSEDSEEERKKRKNAKGKPAQEKRKPQPSSQPPKRAPQKR